MVLPLLFACSHGTLSWPAGSGPLETAFFLPVDDADTPTLYVALSNSYVASCKRPDLRDDPDEALEELYLAVTRENTRVALLELNRYGVDTWEGLFPVASEDFQPNQLSGQDPFIARGSWIGVDEAEVDRDEGLEQTYRVVDGTYVPSVAAPGQVNISNWEEEVALDGSLAFESLDVSSRFRAVPCDAEYDDSIIPLIQSLTFFGEEGSP